MTLPVVGPATFDEWPFIDNVRRFWMAHYGIPHYPAGDGTCWMVAFEDGVPVAVFGYEWQPTRPGITGAITVTDGYRRSDRLGNLGILALVQHFAEMEEETGDALFYALPPIPDHPMLRHLKRWGYAPIATLVGKGAA